MNLTFAFYFYISVVVTAFVISLKYKNKNQPTYLKIIPYFLLLTILVELSGYLLAKYKLNFYNHLVYNNFFSIEFCFYLWVISRIVSNFKLKKLILTIDVLFTISFIINNFWGQGRGLGFPSISYAVGSILIIFGGLIYFYELFQKPNDTPLFQQPAFWICSAIILYYTATFPVFGLVNFLNAYPKIIKNNIVVFVDILNIFLYSLLSIAFVCQSITRKSSQLSSLAVS